MKKRYINGKDWAWIERCTAKWFYIEDIFNGYVAYVKADKVKYTLKVDYEQSDTILLGNGYKSILFSPENEKWSVSAIYNTENQIIEWYFDMVKENTIDEAGNPYYIDLYLDIAVSPNFKTTILDEDELLEALVSGDITRADYDLAHKTCDKLLKDIIPNKDFMISFFSKYLKYFEK